jgi:hypothetical protein
MQAGMELGNPIGSRLGAGLAGAMLLAALLAGCGGSGSLSHAQLAARATTACRQANASVARLGGPGSGYPALRKYAGQVSPIVSRLIHTLDGLKANRADKPALERYVNALQDGEHGLALLARASSPAQLSQATSLLDSESIPSLAGALGAPACGTSISPA